MATVVITFFLFARFHVCKMDADCTEKQREWGFQPTKIAKRHDRFSMDQQRFDEIMAEITTAFNNIRSSFENVKITEILEEVVTDFARAALESAAPPKFAELALLLHHCTALYGRKVDFLYNHVLDVSEALAGAEPASAAGPGAEAEASPGAARRRRRASGAALAGFAHIPLAACGGAVRARSPPRPPPTLPRPYLELEPRAPPAHRLPLRDDAGEPVGLPGDYRAAARLQRGFLVDELEAGGPAPPAPRPLSLLELQRALAAAAPPDPPPAPRAAEPPPAPASPAAPPGPTPPPVFVPPATELLARRKRRSEPRLADIVPGPLVGFVTEELLRWSRRAREFGPPASWVRGVVERRVRRLLAARRRLAPLRARFRGYDDELALPGGFPGWTRAEGAEAVDVAAAVNCSRRISDLESDDDGFFEASSLSSGDSWGTPPPAPPAAPPAEWGARVAAAAAEQEARGGVDVRALGAAVLRALPPAAPPPAAPAPFALVLRRAAAAPHDVSRLLLATLFLANSGNVEIIPAESGDFSVRLLSADQTRFAAAAAAEAALLAPPAPAAPAAPADPVPAAPAPSAGDP